MNEEFCARMGEERGGQWLAVTCHAVVLVALLLAALLASCTATRYVEVPQVHETWAASRDSSAVRDSVFVHDSVTVCLMGDTVRIQEYHVVYKDRWRDRLRVDSFIQRDTVTVVKEVERPPNAWQQAKSSALCWALVIVGAFFLIVIYRFIRG